MPVNIQLSSDQEIPRRVVSLVPSLTESMFDLGFGDSVVGVTDYCVIPAEAKKPALLGGPKNLRVDDVIHLAPDLVIANQEENSQGDILALSQAGLQVWLAFPKTVKESITDLFTLARLFRSEIALSRIRFMEKTLEWECSSAANRDPVRYFCPIWYDSGGKEPWWMTFNHQTYSHDLLASLGYENVFAFRQRRYPLEADLGITLPEGTAGRDTRYPRVRELEVIRSQPELILLPSEPYDFDEAALVLAYECFAQTPAVQNGRVLLVDGSLLTWHGTRLARALAELPALLGGVRG